MRSQAASVAINEATRANSRPIVHRSAKGIRTGRLSDPVRTLASDRRIAAGPCRMADAASYALRFACGARRVVHDLAGGAVVGQFKGLAPERGDYAPFEG